MTVIDAPIDGVGIIAQVAETAAASTRLKVLMYMIDLEAKWHLPWGAKARLAPLIQQNYRLLCSPCSGLPGGTWLPTTGGMRFTRGLDDRLVRSCGAFDEKKGRDR